MAIKYNKRPKNGPNGYKIYQHLPLENPQKFTQIWDFCFENVPSGTPAPSLARICCTPLTPQSAGQHLARARSPPRSACARPPRARARPPVSQLMPTSRARSPTGQPAHAHLARALAHRSACACPPCAQKRCSRQGSMLIVTYNLLAFFSSFLGKNWQVSGGGG
jgi:hypothetical protein